jgi:hypothetical protein
MVRPLSARPPARQARGSDLAAQNSLCIAAAGAVF